MAKKFNFIKTTLNDITVNMNICFISDIIEIKGKAEVFINGEWWKTEITMDELLELYKTP